MDGLPERSEALRHFQSDIAGADDGHLLCGSRRFLDAKRVLQIQQREHVRQIDAWNCGRLRFHARGDQQAVEWEFHGFPGVYADSLSPLA